RVWLVGLAAIAAVLGYLMDNVWLLGIGGALFVVAILTLIGLSVKRRRRRAESERQRAAELTRDDELRSLGISDIRPKGQTARPEETVEEDGWNLAVADDFEAELEASEPVDQGESDYEGNLGEDEPVAEEQDAYEPDDEPDEAPARAGRRVDPVPVQSAPEDSPFWRVHSPTAINSFLRALWAPTEVHTIGLFSAAQNRETYTLEAALPHSPGGRR